jgi:hypothetical protein
MALTPSSDLAAASWIAGADQSWQRLAEFGPPGFSAYGRLRFLPDPAFDGQSEHDVNLAEDAPSETAQLRAALEVLARHTTAPDDCYFCLWDGWGWTVAEGDSGWALKREQSPPHPAEPMLTSAPPAGAIPARRDRPHDPPPAPPVAKVVIPNRAYFLFRGSVSDLGDWGSGRSTEAPSMIRMPDPAFVWPADHAWCVANDVDPHWAGIGADTAAIDQLLADSRLDVVLADPDRAQPTYR